MKSLLSATILISVLLLAQRTAMGEVIQLGASRLTSLQNADGGWDDPLNYNDRSATSPTDYVGQIGLGLVHAYLRTNNVAFKTAAEKAGTLLLSKTDNFSACDGLFAKQLDRIVGGAAYGNYVKTNFYDALAAGSYSSADGNTTAAYVNTYLEAYPGKYAGWYLGMALGSAKAVGVSNTSEWVRGVKDALVHLNSQNGAGAYQTFDLAGSIYGLASAGESSFTPLSDGPLSGISTLSALANELASLQLGSGGFKVDKTFGVGSESTEATAYSILALSAVDGVNYKHGIQQAGTYLQLAQLVTGGWQDDGRSGEANVVTGDALSGISTAVPEPNALILVIISGLSVLVFQRVCLGRIKKWCTRTGGVH
jgi:hypothetical protein